MTHADPVRRVLTTGLAASYAAHAEPHPTCRVCGHKLAAGDYVDPFHPYDHSGNLHQRCAADAPARRSY